MPPISDGQANCCGNQPLPSSRSIEGQQRELSQNSIAQTAEDSNEATPGSNAAILELSPSDLITTSCNVQVASAELLCILHTPDRDGHFTEATAYSSDRFASEQIPIYRHLHRIYLPNPTIELIKSLWASGLPALESLTFHLPHKLEFNCRQCTEFCHDDFKKFTAILAAFVGLPSANRKIHTRFKKDPEFQKFYKQLSEKIFDNADCNYDLVLSTLLSNQSFLIYCLKHFDLLELFAKGDPLLFQQYDFMIESADYNAKVLRYAHSKLLESEEFISRLTERIGLRALLNPKDLLWNAITKPACEVNEKHTCQSNFTGNDLELEASLSNGENPAPTCLSTTIPNFEALIGKSTGMSIREQRDVQLKLATSIDPNASNAELTDPAFPIMRKQAPFRLSDRQKEEIFNKTCKDQWRLQFLRVLFQSQEGFLSALESFPELCQLGPKKLTSDADVMATAVERNRKVRLLLPAELRQRVDHVLAARAICEASRSLKPHEVSFPEKMQICEDSVVDPEHHQSDARENQSQPLPYSDQIVALEIPRSPWKQLIDVNQSAKNATALIDSEREMIVYKSGEISPTLAKKIQDEVVDSSSALRFIPEYIKRYAAFNGNYSDLFSFNLTKAILNQNPDIYHILPEAYQLNIQLAVTAIKKNPKVIPFNSVLRYQINALNRNLIQAEFYNSSYEILSKSPERNNLEMELIMNFLFYDVEVIDYFDDDLLNNQEMISMLSGQPRVQEKVITKINCKRQSKISQSPQQPKTACSFFPWDEDSSDLTQWFDFNSINDNVWQFIE